MRYPELKRFSICLLLQLSIVFACFSSDPANTLKLFKPDHPRIEYTGRIDFRDPLLPRFWAPGVYIRAAFTGTAFEVIIHDEMLWGDSHNYVSVVIDNDDVRRIKLSERTNVLKFDGLADGSHTVLVCKSTESGIGYLEFGGIRCKDLLKLTPLQRKIEFIGNSITCGMGSDESAIACDKGVWYDQHNAYMSYGAQTARALNARWMLTSVSGIGLIHSCCEMTLKMPDVYDKIDLRENKMAWDFSKYAPDVVTICLGQNDGIQDSTKFCGAYVSFIATIRKKYPSASIVCLTSPMADEKLVGVMKNYISSITRHLKKSGDANVHQYFFSKQFSKGCGSHPDLKEHGEIAAELSHFLRELKDW